MRTVFGICEAAVLSRCNLLEVCTKLAVAFDETMENVAEIRGVDQVKISARRCVDSSHHHMKFGFPLSINCRITDSLGKTGLIVNL